MKKAMKHPNAGDLKRLAQKLQEQNDITLQEADWVFSLHTPSLQKTKFNRYSPKLDVALIQASDKFYRTVTEKIEQGHRGNFIFSLPWDSYELGAVGYAIGRTQDALNIYGRPEDLFSQLTVNAELYNSFPRWFQRLFTKIDRSLHDHKSFYTLESPRPGMYYYPVQTEEGARTIAEFLKRLSSVEIKHDRQNFNDWALFAMAADIWDSSMPWWIRKDGKDGWSGISFMNECTVGAYLKYKNTPLILMKNRVASRTMLFTEKARLVECALQIPFEDIVQNALHKNVIDTSAAKELLSDNVIREPLFEEFIKTSIECIDKIVQNVQREICWETAQKTIEEENKWLEVVDR